MSRWTDTILGDTSDDPEKLSRKLRRVARGAALKAQDLGLEVDGAVTGRDPAISVDLRSKRERKDSEAGRAQ